MSEDICQVCKSAPADWGSDSPDDRLRTRYCSLHVPLWLKNLYYREGLAIPGIPSPKRSG
jgi:hypothetical protein